MGERFRASCELLRAFFELERRVRVTLAASANRSLSGRSARETLREMFVIARLVAQRIKCIYYILHSKREDGLRFISVRWSKGAGPRRGGEYIPRCSLPLRRNVLLSRFESAAQIACRRGETPGFFHLYIARGDRGPWSGAPFARQRLEYLRRPRQLPRSSPKAWRQRSSWPSFTASATDLRGRGVTIHLYDRLDRPVRHQTASSRPASAMPAARHERAQRRPDESPSPSSAIRDQSWRFPRRGSISPGCSGRSGCLRLREQPLRLNPTATSAQ